MNYEDISDFDINKSVAKTLGYKNYYFHYRYDATKGDFQTPTQLRVRDGNANEKILDYCNNPSDAWPIIESNNIDIVASRGSAKTSGAQCKGFFAGDKNKLRAAMIVYLEVCTNG